MLAQALSGLRERLRKRARISIDNPRSRRAAVLVPLVARASGAALLFFERTHDVMDHKGEICFPGGSLEPQDANATDAALREAQEELALPRTDVNLLGLLDDVETVVSNYTITPVVGLIESNPTLAADPLEVARIIEVPLSRFFAVGVGHEEQAAYEGVSKLRYSYSIDGDRIWGATARIVHNLLETLREIS